MLENPPVYDRKVHAFVLDQGKYQLRQVFSQYHIMELETRSTEILFL